VLSLSVHEMLTCLPLALQRFPTLRMQAELFLEETTVTSGAPEPADHLDRTFSRDVSFCITPCPSFAVRASSVLLGDRFCP